MTDVTMIVHNTDSGGTPLLSAPWIKATPGAINRITYSSDLTNVAWSANNMAVTKSAVGLRNAPAGACILTANAANATVLRTNAFTAVSGTQLPRFWLKRLTGVGTVSITANGGSSWVDVTNQLSGLEFTPISFSISATANPVIGIRLGTSGDEVIVGNAELYANVSNTGFILGLPPIFCEASEVTLNTSAMAFSNANHGNSGCYVLEYRPNLASGVMSVDQQILSLAGGPDLLWYDGTAKAFKTKDSANNTSVKAQALVQDTTYVIGIAFGDGKLRICVDGAWGNEVTFSGAFPSGSSLELAKAITYNAEIRKLRRWSGNYVAAVQRVNMEMPPPNIPPVADPGGPYSVSLNQEVQFSGAGSYDSDGVIVSYAWNFGDGNFGTGVSPTHIYTEGTGPFNVSLTVTDDDGAQHTAWTTVTITATGFPWIEDIKEAEPEYLVPMIRGKEVNGALVSLGTAKMFPSNAIASTYSYVSGKNMNAITDLVNGARAFNPNFKWFMRICAQEYQGDSDGYANFTSGPQFRGTGPVSDGMNVFAGHWAYQRWEPIVADVNSTTLTVYVNSAAGINLSHSPYACISRPDWADAEHVRIASIDTSVTPNRITLVSRGYKSTAQAHTVASGARIALHQRGNVDTNLTFWSRNVSTICPRDGNNKRFIDFLSDWVVAHFLRNPTDTGPIAAQPDGIEDDSSFDLFFTGNSSAEVTRAIACDNGTTPDWGFTRDGSMVNLWGAGYDEYWQMLQEKLWAAGHTWASVISGDGKVLGRVGTIGSQIEGGPDNTYGQPPSYLRLLHYEGTAKFANRHPYGQAISDVQNRTPSLTYGGDTDNSAIRFAMCWAWVYGHYHSNQNNDPYADRWFEEYAVYPTGVCVPVANTTDRRTYRGWMGPPSSAGYRYLENPASWEWANNAFSNGDLSGPLTGWTFTNVAYAFDTQYVARGTRSLKVTPGPQYLSATVVPSINAAVVQTPSMSFAANQYHTVCISIYSQVDRWVQIYLAGQSEWLYPLAAGWNQIVYTIRTGGSAVNGTIRIDCGFSRSPIWIDQIYLKNNARANVWMREFNNALVIANGSNTSVTVTLPFTCDRLQGYQDTGAPMNTGVTGINSITVPAKDGVVLKRAA